MQPWALSGMLGLLAGGPAQQPTGPPGPGEWIAFRRWGPEGGIYAVRPGGTELHLIGAAGVGISLAWAPDGTRLAYDEAPGPGRCTAYVVSADGTGRMDLIGNTGEFPVTLAWSPDGQTIAFQSQDEPEPGVYLIGADGTDERRVPNTGEAGSVCWSPDGRLLAVLDCDGPGIYTIGLDGGGRRRVTATQAWPGFAWSPSSGLIAFYAPAADELRLIRPDGTDEHALPLPPGPWTGTSWSPDGTRIALCQQAADRSTIWVANADGTGLTQLTDGPWEVAPAWWGPRSKKRVVGP